MSSINKIIRILTVSFISAVSTLSQAAPPNAFSTGAPILASEFNENFNDLDARVSTNEAGLTTNNSATTSNTSNINSNVTGITSNSGNISSNVTAISNNAGAIGNNSANISINASTVSTATANTAANTTAIGTNAGGITGNAAAIGSNAAGITGNTTAIGSNSSGISTNAADISTNVSAIETNSTDIADNFSSITGNTSNITSNFSALDQRLNTVETATTQTIAVDCLSDPLAFKNTVLTPNTTYVLTGICDGQIAISGPELGTIVVKGDAIGIKDDGITLPAGETDARTIFAAVYGQDAVRVFLENLVIDASAYNGEADLFVGAVGSYRASHVYLENVDVIGGDYGLGAYNTGTASILGGVRVVDFGLNGLRAERASVIRVFDTLEVTGGTNQDWTSSEAVGAYSGGVIVIDDDGNPATSHSITPSSGPNINIAPDDNVAAVSAWQNGTIKIWDANITGVLWSGDSSVVDLRNVIHSDGYINPYRNSVMRFRDSQVGNGSAADMTIYAGDFSVLRMDDTTVGNVSGTETANTYRYGVIDLRGTTAFGGRNINCAESREVSIRASVTGVGIVSCVP